MRLDELSAFNAAARHVSGLLLASLLGGVAALLVLAAPLPGAARAMSASVGAALSLAAAGFAGACCLALARRLARRAEGLEPSGAAEAAYRRARRRATWQQVAVSGVLAGLAACAIAIAGNRGGGWEIAPRGDATGAALCLAAAFGLLVLERHLAAHDPDALPEAPALAALLRLPVAVLLVCGAGCMLLYGGIGAGALAGRLACLPCIVVAAEMLARMAATLFVPFPPPNQERLVAVSGIAAALRWDRRPRLGATARDWLGIDLSRSWALGFVRGAAAPVAGALTLLGWGLTGITALRLDQRAIYERFGHPIGVLGPGLHLHLPWPIGRLRPVELGVMHDVPIVYDGASQTAADTSGAAAPAAGAPGTTLADRLWNQSVRLESASPATAPTVAPAPASPGDPEAAPAAAEDRLWDQSHPNEAAYLVASLSRGQQSFESVDIDLRVVYRVGLSDRAAMQAAYAVGDPQRLVQSRTSRLLAHYFAGHTLPDILGADRGGFSRAIGGALQDELDRSGAGIDIMAVVVEAVHPPPGAASAYHAVQAAAIAAHTAIAEQSGLASTSEAQSRREATERRDLALVQAHEAVVEARVQAILFEADRTASARDGASFVMERRLERLGAGLAHRQLLIIDHRLERGDAPTIDLRPQGAPAVPSEDPSRLAAP